MSRHFHFMLFHIMYNSLSNWQTCTVLLSGYCNAVIFKVFGGILRLPTNICCRRYLPSVRFKPTLAGLKGLGSWKSHKGSTHSCGAESHLNGSTHYFGAESHFKGSTHYYGAISLKRGLNLVSSYKFRKGPLHWCRVISSERADTLGFATLWSCQGSI